MIFRLESVSLDDFPLNSLFLEDFAPLKSLILDDFPLEILVSR